MKVAGRLGDPGEHHPRGDAGGRALGVPGHRIDEPVADPLDGSDGALGSAGMRPVAIGDYDGGEEGEQTYPAADPEGGHVGVRSG